jgi:tRNA-specific 2-thiouridylase
VDSPAATESAGVGAPGYSILRKGVDPRKDQSYFLFSLRQPQLRRALTPLGTMAKPQIREIAHSLGLKVADKVDSQEICFVPGNDYKAFLRSHLGEDEFHRGEIYDVAGNLVGEHDGIELFTIGQRKGLPGGSPRPRYVVDVDPATNRVIVGDADDLVCEEFEIDRVNWHAVAGIGDPGRSFEATVKIRYSHPGTRATVVPLENDCARVRLHDPQRAVTPGQAAVIYDGDVVLGGGWICRAERREDTRWNALSSTR